MILCLWVSTDMLCLTMGIRSEKCVVRRFRHCANVYLQEPRQYSLHHTEAIWYSLLLLGCKPVQHVTVLDTVGNCNRMVNIIIQYCIIILWDLRFICSPSLTKMLLHGTYLYFQYFEGLHYLYPQGVVVHKEWPCGKKGCQCQCQ